MYEQFSTNDSQMFIKTFQSKKETSMFATTNDTKCS